MLVSFTATLETTIRRAILQAQQADWLDRHWTGMRNATAGQDVEQLHETAVPLDTLREVGTELCLVPEGFNLNRRSPASSRPRSTPSRPRGHRLGVREALAFASLLLEAIASPVRWDVQRGTFSTPAYLIGEVTLAEYVPLNNIRVGQPRSTPTTRSCRSSRLASTTRFAADPHTLVLWKASSATSPRARSSSTVIASAETKRLRMSGW